MKYSVQTYHKRRDASQADWRTVSPLGALPQEFDDEVAAIRCFNRNADMARMIWAMRVITSDGKVIRYYDPELDIRLPGPRHRAIKQSAYLLWMAAGQPNCDGKEFWFKAESEISNTTNSLNATMKGISEDVSESAN